jgi:glutamine synthetase
MSTVTEIFGSNVFNDVTMRERLPKDTYKALQKTIKGGQKLDIQVATVVANAMKDWAIEKGATHFTHWFQPMTGITAEKHDSFISPTPNGQIIMEFSGKELVRGEPDASSFPSGGLRATFEARGYTAWDPTSYAFIKDKTLCIPTAFCSYSGDSLDKKTPLLRSMQAINRQALRVLKLFGHSEVTSVNTTVGLEQEYFLVDKDVYDKRRDLIYTGRTLFGARPPKGQELEDHYFGSIKPRVQEFMEDLDRELWKLGVLAKTEHNEVAPAQHELAPIFTTANIAVDHNQLTMEMMRKVAQRHNMVCLLHEKPFAGVNGSGKHNNWAISTNTGINLLEPGETPYDNAQFLLFLCAVIKAVDDYQELLRVSVASAGNDHRLGANEAPPAVVSIFLGDELTEILNSIESGKPYGGRKKEQLKIGVDVLPRFFKDTTDRNRTSPFAFTGNKFEFRMPGATLSMAGPNVVLNTAVAEELRQFADELENAEDFTSALNDLIKRVIKEHKRIIFNGNGYDDTWIEEALRRGLPNLRSTPDCMPAFISEKSVQLFTSHGVYSRAELQSHYDIKLDNYAKIINIEAQTMLDMSKKDILPAVSAYAKSLADTIAAKKAVSADIDCSYETETLAKISRIEASMFAKMTELEKAVIEAKETVGVMETAIFYKDHVIPAMNELRVNADELETLTAKEYWPFPSYGDLLFGVR